MATTVKDTNRKRSRTTRQPQRISDEEAEEAASTRAGSQPGKPRHVADARRQASKHHSRGLRSRQAGSADPDVHSNTTFIPTPRVKDKGAATPSAGKHHTRGLRSRQASSADPDVHSNTSSQGLGVVLAMGIPARPNRPEKARPGLTRLCHRAGLGPVFRARWSGRAGRAAHGQL